MKSEDGLLISSKEKALKMADKAKKPTRKADAMGPKSKATAKTYKTAAGAQQYVRGNSPEERREVLKKAKVAALSSNKTYGNLSAAGMANESKLISKIRRGKKNDTTKMYDKMEKDFMEFSKKSKK
jgi:hypothetical protein